MALHFPFIELTLSIPITFSRCTPPTSTIVILLLLLLLGVSGWMMMIGIVVIWRSSGSIRGWTRRFASQSLSLFQYHNPRVQINLLVHLMLPYDYNHHQQFTWHTMLLTVPTTNASNIPSSVCLHLICLLL